MQSKIRLGWPIATKYLYMYVYLLDRHFQCFVFPLQTPTHRKTESLPESSFRPLSLDASDVSKSSMDAMTTSTSSVESASKDRNANKVRDVTSTHHVRGYASVFYFTNTERNTSVYRNFPACCWAAISFKFFDSRINPSSFGIFCWAWKCIL